MTSFEDREADWLGVLDAVDRILEHAVRLGEEEIDLSRALGRALARDLEARATLPPWDNSAMDGYAVRSEDVDGATEAEPVVLSVVGVVNAGGIADAPVGPGEAVRIMTGAPIPPGADSVIRVEHTDAEAGTEGRVRILSDADRGRHVRAGGRDMRRGDDVLKEGTTITPGVAAVAAALGHHRLPVRERPRVAVLSSGEELRGPDRFDEVIEGRGVPDSNGPLLEAAVRDAGCEAVPLGIAGDDVDDIRARVERARRCHALVTTGGASMGEADLFKRALDSIGLDVLFWRTRIRPGSPFSFGRLPLGGPSPLPHFGLPGNPASAFVTFQVFVRPFLLALAGHRRIHRRVVVATAGERLASTPRLTHFHRVTLGGPPERPVARLTGPQSSGLVRSLAEADGLAVVPEGVEAIEEGDAVSVLLLDDGPAAMPAPGYPG